MEKFPKKGKIETIARSALAGATMLGAVEASRPTVAEAAPRSYEQQETFDADVEAQAFFGEVGRMEVGIDDARGRMTLKTAIAEKFNAFTLSFEKKTPFFSSGSSGEMQGSVSAPSRERARQFILPKLATMTLQEGEPLWVLRAMLTGSPRTLPPEHINNGGGAGGVGDTGRVEIRRNRTQDW
ncbi:hypothetical protein FJY93_04145 [Candidatus Kaiserbacteria bacterium]|nr:hypothetical protein [Candidatus Kaiserbacteria bacterium]